MTYIYVFENGDLAYSLRPPTARDLASIASGDLRVLAVPNLFLHEINSLGVNAELEQCGLVGPSDAEYHAL